MQPPHRLAGLALLLALCACGDDASPKPPQRASVPSAALLRPDPRALQATAPDSFFVVFETSKGDIEVLVHRRWSPRGADRLYYLVVNEFFTGSRFHRVVSGFIAQFGLNTVPAVNAAFDSLTIADEPPMRSNSKGTLTFGRQTAANSRSTQLFFNLSDNVQLDSPEFAPVGEVVRGMSIVKSLFSDHGQGVSDAEIKREGRTYLGKFPQLDSIVHASIKR